MTNTSARPRIGVTARTLEKEYFDHWMRNYWWAVIWAGGEPVMLTPELATLPPDLQIAQLDGLLLSGGGDLHPRFYGESLNGSDLSDIHEARDVMELALARAALAADLPILGVCRGMQVLNVAEGGSLVQHIEGHQSPPGDVRYHDVDLTPGSLLAQVLGAAGLFRTNTFHHQAVTIERLAPGLRPVAYATDDRSLLEGVVNEDRRWVVGVEWHPERFYELTFAHRRLFTGLVAAAKAYSLVG